MKIPDGTQSDEIQKHFRQCGEEIYLQEKNGHYQQIQKKTGNFASLKANPSVPAALWGHYSFTQNSIERHSYLYLTVYRNYFVKFRFTYPKQEEATALKTLNGFLKALGKIFVQAVKP